MQDKKIGFIGLGKLGGPVAETMYSRYEVLGYDTQDVDVSVPKASTIKEVAENTDIIFVAVPTPHAKSYGGDKPISHKAPENFDYTALTNVLKELDKHTTEGQTISVISTVLPGTIRSLSENVSKAKLIYNPYLIAMSTVVKDFVDPEMIIIGTDSGERNDPHVKALMDVYEDFVVLGTRYEVGTWEEAESVKIFYNTFISAKIGLVNMIQDVANRLGNINVDNVTGPISRSSKRITSGAYMTAGMGDGGPCHPRDNIALSWLAEELDLGYDLFKSIMYAREKQAENVATLLNSYKLPVVILGTQYKKGTGLEDGSYSLLVGHYVEQNNKNVYYYDPDLRTTDLPSGPAVYFVSFHEKWLNDLEVAEGSVFVDPWRKLEYWPNATVVHYGKC